MGYGQLAKLNGEHTEGAFRDVQMGTLFNKLIQEIADLKKKVADLEGAGDLDVTTVDAVDVDSGVVGDVVALANDLKAKYELHRADAGMHVNADTTNAITAADATDQSSANTLLNELKADINAHHSQATVHLNDDGDNAIASANASDLATSITLANELKADYDLHVLGNDYHKRLGSSDQALLV